MYRKIDQEISIESMRSMRENGMTNREIADRCGCSSGTVLRYIGKQPSGLRASPHVKIHDIEHDNEKKKQEKPVLTCLSSVAQLSGLVNLYKVDKVEKTVCIIPTDVSLSYTAKDLEYLIAEICDVKNMLERGVEM